MHELFALLNFICPKVISHYDDLGGFLHKDVQEESGSEGGEKVVMVDKEKSAAVVAALQLKHLESKGSRLDLPSKYCRIDGGTAHGDRIAAIDEYNKPRSEKFILLLALE
ncbi:hypothetical protein FRC10_003235, partial [Ceratobasidium sp. 414]